MELERAQIRLTGAMPSAFLNECARRGIPFQHAVEEDACTLHLCLRTGDLERAGDAAEHCGCRLALLESRGAPLAWNRLRRRCYLALGMLLVVLALFWSSL